MWLRVGSDSAEQVYQALARPSGEEQAMATAFHAESAAATLRRILDRSRATLLVFDDVWWNRRAFSEVLQALAKKLPVLATSRQRFSSMGAIHDVTDLELPDALALLSYHARCDCSKDEAAARDLSAPWWARVLDRACGQKLLERRGWSTAALLDAVSQDAPQELEIPDYGSKQGEGTGHVRHDNRGAG